MKKALALILCLVLFTGPGYGEEINASNNFPWRVWANGQYMDRDLLEGEHGVADASTRTYVVRQPAAPGDVLDFNLGTETVLEGNGKEVPFSLIGGIAVPETDNNPVVVVVHGRHDAEKPEEYRYDLGYSYLLKALADNGYLAISINANIANTFAYGEPVGFNRLLKLFDLHLEKLTRANDGADAGYGVDLMGKANLKDISLIGHSAGGQGVFYIADDQAKKGVKIQAILAVAPSIIQPLEEIELVAGHTAVILPQYDDDVMMLDGQQIFDTLNERPEAYAHLTYLYGADHNSFNEAVRWKGMYTYEPEHVVYPRITPERQREFLTKYALDFLSVAHGGKAGESGFTAANEAPATLYGMDVLTSLKTPGAKALSLTAFTATDGMTAQTTRIFDAPSETDSPDAFTPPQSKPAEVLELMWEHQGASVNLLPEESFGGYQALDFLIAQDSSSPLNGFKDQSFTVLLEDGNGCVQEKRIDAGTPALSHQAGGLVTEEVWEMTFSRWSTFTPFSSLRIHASDFDEIDWSCVRKITLRMDQTDDGRLLLASVNLLP